MDHHRGAWRSGGWKLGRLSPRMLAMMTVVDATLLSAPCCWCKQTTPPMASSCITVELREVSRCLSPSSIATCRKVLRLILDITGWGDALVSPSSLPLRVSVCPCLRVRFVCVMSPVCPRNTFSRIVFFSPVHPPFFLLLPLLLDRT